MSATGALSLPFALASVLSVLRSHSLCLWCIVAAPCFQVRGIWAQGCHSGGGPRRSCAGDCLAALAAQVSCITCSCSRLCSSIDGNALGPLRRRVPLRSRVVAGASRPVALLCRFWHFPAGCFGGVFAVLVLVSPPLRWSSCVCFALWSLHFTVAICCYGGLLQSWAAWP